MHRIIVHLKFYFSSTSLLTIPSELLFPSKRTYLFFRLGMSSSTKREHKASYFSSKLRDTIQVISSGYSNSSSYLRLFRSSLFSSELSFTFLNPLSSKYSKIFWATSLRLAVLLKLGIGWLSSLMRLMRF